MRQLIKMSMTFKQKLIFLSILHVYVAPPSIVHPVDFRDRKYYKDQDRVSLQYNVLVGKIPKIKTSIQSIVYTCML